MKSGATTINDYMIEHDLRLYTGLVRAALKLVLKEIRADQAPGRGDSCQLKRIGAYMLRDELIESLNEQFDKQRGLTK